MRITGTFLDEISWDIPHQNWGYEEWKKDFLNMKAIQIDTVILIRCGLDRWIAYPSDCLVEKMGCYRPDTDLVELFLEIADELEMRFFFGTYVNREGNDSCEQLKLNYEVAREAWAKYGHHPSFQGWYLSQEISRGTRAQAEAFRDFGKFCKELSGGLPVLISPLIDGVKNVSGEEGNLEKKETITLEEHTKMWDEIFSILHEGVDIVAFQDGHCAFHELADYLKVNKVLAEKYGMECWSNCETFDRDMPIRFLPIKWEKLLFKLKAAETAGIRKVITFEFSHFMSPDSVYLAAGNLYRRYRDKFGIGSSKKV